MLNMLQPVYVFVIFVCKRNVIDMLLGRTKDKRGTTRSGGKGGYTGARMKNINKNSRTGGGGPIIKGRSMDVVNAERLLEVAPDTRSSFSVTDNKTTATTVLT